MDYIWVLVTALQNGCGDLKKERKQNIVWSLAVFELAQNRKAFRRIPCHEYWWAGKRPSRIHNTSSPFHASSPHIIGMRGTDFLLDPTQGFSEAAKVGVYQCSSWLTQWRLKRQWSPHLMWRPLGTRRPAPSHCSAVPVLLWRWFLLEFGRLAVTFSHLPQPYLRTCCWEELLTGQGGRERAKIRLCPWGVVVHTWCMLVP